VFEALIAMRVAKVEVMFVYWLSGLFARYGRLCGGMCSGGDMSGIVLLGYRKVRRSVQECSLTLNPVWMKEYQGRH
jgi:hypothetical protein